MSGHEYIRTVIYDLTKQNMQLRTDRDELRATLSGLCHFLGMGTPDDSTPAAEMNRWIHAGIRKREEAARGEDRDELRRVLERCLKHGQLPFGVAQEAEKLLKGDA